MMGTCEISLLERVSVLMQFLLILAVVGAISISENAPSEPVAAGGLRLAAALAGMALVATFAAGAAGITSLGLRLDGDQHRRWLRWFGRVRSVHTALWAAVTATILYGLGWTQMVRYNWQLDGMFLADDVLILLPVVLPLVLSWAAFYEVDRAVERGGFALSVHKDRSSSRSGYVGLHIRHYLGLILLPVLLLLGLQDAATFAAPGLSESERVWIVSIPLLAAMFVGFPVLLRYVWRTEPLPESPLRRRLERVAQTHGAGTRDILIWHTGDRVVNAAVTGFVPHMRYVFLTDALIRRFSDEEIEAIFAHELGHIRYHHLPLRAMALVAPLMLLFSLMQYFSAGDAAVLVGSSMVGSVEAMVLGLVGMAAYLFFVFGRYSRLLEQQADLFACDNLRVHANGAEGFIATLEKLSAVGGGRRGQTTWLHPSIAARAAFLATLAGRPRAEQRFHAKMWWLGVVVVGGMLAATVVRVLAG